MRYNFETGFFTNKVHSVVRVEGEYVKATAYDSLLEQVMFREDELEHYKGRYYDALEEADLTRDQMQTDLALANKLNANLLDEIVAAKNESIFSKLFG
jgi:hypothetical protein